MKKIIISVLMVFLAFNTAFAAPKIVKFAGQWPFHPTKMIAVDADQIGRASCRERV